MGMRMLRGRWCGVVARRCRSGMNDVLTEATLAGGGAPARRFRQRRGHYVLNATSELPRDITKGRNKYFSRKHTFIRARDSLL